MGGQQACLRGHEGDIDVHGAHGAGLSTREEESSAKSLMCIVLTKEARQTPADPTPAALLNRL